MGEPCQGAAPAARIAALDTRAKSVLARNVWLAGPAAGLVLGVLAYAFFAGQDASIKWLVSGFGAAAVPVWQILFVRSLFIVLATVAAGGRPMLRRAVATPMKQPLVGRAVITLAAWLCYYSSSRTLPLAQMLTLYFSAPIIATILARPLLGEFVPGSRWACVGLGFVGVLVACDPGRLSTSWAAAMVLVAASFWGVAIILMRRIARRESSLLQMFYTNAVFLVPTGIGSLLAWQPVTAHQAALLGLICVAGTCGQVCLFEGARRAPASMMATVEYSALVWAFLLGFVVFGDIPDVAVFAGAALILGAGVLLLATERRRLVQGAAGD